MKIANFFLKRRMHVCHWQRSNETVIISRKKIILSGLITLAVQGLLYYGWLSGKDIEQSPKNYSTEVYFSHWLYAC